MSDASKQGLAKRAPLHGSGGRALSRNGVAGGAHVQVDPRQGKDGMLFVSAHGLDRGAQKRAGASARGSSGGTWRRSSVNSGKPQPLLPTQQTPVTGTGHNTRANSAPVLQRRGQSSGGAQPPSGRKNTVGGGGDSGDIGGDRGDGPLPQPPSDFTPPDRPVAANPSPSYLETWTYDGYATSKGSSSERVSIHVHDEVSNVSRNFICKRDVLLREMRYFNTYLSSDCSLDDLDISVHCDVSIFRWLMEYVHNEPENRPKPDPTVAVSILISSDFLQMQGLVEESLHYVMKHFQEIIKLPIDLDCINKDLDKIRDRKDKMVGALFLQKIQELLVTTGPDSEPRNVLYRCALCSRLFTLKQQAWSVCHESMPIITFNGESVSEHVVDPTWDVSMYLASLRAKRLSWKEIYWRLWSLINDDVCMVCARHFTIAEIAHCSYHEYLPRFELNSAVGVFPCCGVEVQRFEGGTVRQSGCKSRYHILSDTAQKELVMDIVSRHPYVLIPKEDEANELSNSLTSHLLGSGDSPDSETEGSESDDTFGPDWRRRSKWSAAAAAANANAANGTAGDDAGRRGRGGKRGPSLAGTTSEASRHTPYRLDHTFLANGASRGAGAGGGGGGGRAKNPSSTISANVTRRTAKSAGGRKAAGAAGLNGEWFHRLGPKARAAFLVDIQRESDQKRMQSLVSFLEKRRADADKNDGRREPVKAYPAKKPGANAKKQSAGFGRTGR